MIHRFCIGGGLDIALSCDFRFSANDWVFAITPAKLGIVYNLTSTKRLVDLVGSRLQSARAGARDLRVC